MRANVRTGEPLSDPELLLGDGEKSASSAGSGFMCGWALSLRGMLGGVFGLATSEGAGAWLTGDLVGAVCVRERVVGVEGLCPMRGEGNSVNRPDGGFDTTGEGAAAEGKLGDVALR